MEEIKTPKAYMTDYPKLSRYDYDLEHGATLEQIEFEAQSLSQAYELKGWYGTISVSLFIDTFPTWYTCKSTWIGDKVHVDYHEDYPEDKRELPDTYSHFVIFYHRYDEPPEKLGEDKHNDCVYNSIKRIIGMDNMIWSHPVYLKKYLGLNRDDKVDISHFPKLEQAFKKYRINVYGDVTYTSTKTAQLEINLLSSHGHITPKLTKPHITGISFKERIPYLFSRQYVKEGNKLNKITQRIYDPEIGKEREISQKEFESIITNPQSSKYVLIATDKLQSKKERKKSLKELYDEFIHDAEELKFENEMINLYKTGTEKATALKLMHDLTEYIKPDPIDQLESDFIEASTSIFMAFAEPYEGKTWHYDVSGFYPSIMIDSHKMFPFKAGTPDEIKELTEILPYGFYHVHISSPDKKKFQTNYTNWYTHIDIYRARELNLKIELIQSSPNAYIYTRDKLLLGSEIFKGVLNIIIDLKTRGVGRERVSRISKLFWGSLCEKNLKKLIIKDYDGKYRDPLPSNCIIESFKPFGDKSIIEYYDLDEIYKTSYARIKPFILAFGRSKISSLMKPYIDNILRCNCDGFYSKKRIEDIVITKGFGQLVYKGYCEHGIIKNTNNKVGEFKI